MMKEKSNPLKNKSHQFAIRIVNLAQHLGTNHTAVVLSKQILRSGTAIGALVSEAQYAESKPDFAHKLSIALKEANETLYWLHLLSDTQHISPAQHHSMESDCNELKALLISSIKTVRKK